MSGRLCGAPLGELPGEERQRVYYYSIFPGAFLTIQPDFAMATRIFPLAVDRTRVVCDFLFAPETLGDPSHDIGSEMRIGIFDQRHYNFAVAFADTYHCHLPAGWARHRQCEVQ